MNVEYKMQSSYKNAVVKNDKTIIKNVFIILPTPKNLINVNQEEVRVLAQQASIDYHRALKTFKKESICITCSGSPIPEAYFAPNIQPQYVSTYCFEELPSSQYTFIISGHGNENGVGLFSRRIRFTELANSFKSFPKEVKESEIHFSFHACNSAYFLNKEDEKRAELKSGLKRLDLSPQELEEKVIKNSYIGHFFRAIKKQDFKNVSVKGIHGFFSGTIVAPVFPLTECKKQHQFDTRQQEITIDNTEQVITNKKFIPYVREFKLAFASQ